MDNNNRHLEQVVAFQIDKTNKLLKQYSQRIFDEAGLGITVEQWVLLKIIETWAPLSQKELAKKSVRDPAAITRTLTLLQRKGLIERQPSVNDRRQQDISLSTSGASFVRQHMASVDSQRAQSTRLLSAVEEQTLLALLKKVQQSLVVPDANI